MVRLFYGLFLAGWLAGCAPLAAVTSKKAAPARWLRTELYFATGIQGRPDKISPEEWRIFLDDTVTPLFPDGLTVADAFGQWRSKDQAVAKKLVSKILIILHPDNPETRSRIERIRESWKAQYHHESVLRASGPVEVAF